MAQGEKPYRVYRGGRVKGRVPTLSKPERTPARTDRKPFRFKGPGPKPAKAKGKANWRRRILIGVALLFVLLIVWAVASYLSLRSGANAANKRLPRSAKAALVPQSGLMLSHPSTILLLGTDHSTRIKERTGFQRADSIMLLRTDPGKGRLNYLSIPRDLRVEVPGHGFDKINVAFQLGGPSLAIRTVRRFTDIEVNHVVVVDFDAFIKVIDKVGGVDINVPAPILSNKFDCPFKTQARCDRWQGWRFAKGTQHMNGRRARVYSRIRENKLNPGESDITRTERQQEVIQALLSKLDEPGRPRQAALHRRRHHAPADDRPLGGPADPDRGREEAKRQRAALQARRDSELRQLPPARRGGPADRRRVPRPIGAAAALAGVGLRLRLPVLATKTHGRVGRLPILDLSMCFFRQCGFKPRLVRGRGA